MTREKSTEPGDPIGIEEAYQQTRKIVYKNFSRVPHMSEPEEIVNEIVADLELFKRVPEREFLNKAINFSFLKAILHWVPCGYRGNYYKPSKKDTVIPKISRSSELENEDGVGPKEPEDPEDCFRHIENKEVLYGIMVNSGMTAWEAQALYLKYIIGFSYRDISEVTGMTHQAAYQAVERALKKCRSAAFYLKFISEEDLHARHYAGKRGGSYNPAGWEAKSYFDGPDRAAPAGDTGNLQSTWRGSCKVWFEELAQDFGGQRAGSCNQSFFQVFPA